LNEDTLIPRILTVNTDVKLSAREHQNYRPSSIISASSRMNKQCSSYPKTDMDCCSFGDPCGVGEGDCDFDIDCRIGLRCGRDNCYYNFPSPDIRNNWDVMADCCYGKKE
jgi:hypothetical protein